jgi:hypothetical protein
MRVPRDGSIILSMLAALLVAFLLPLVFLGALAHSTDAHPPSLRETLAMLAQPIAAALEHALTFLRELTHRSS